jgi:hypothetical protein
MYTIIRHALAALLYLVCNVYMSVCSVLLSILTELHVLTLQAHNAQASDSFSTRKLLKRAMPITTCSSNCLEG